MRDIKPKRVTAQKHADCHNAGVKRATNMEIEQSLMVKCATSRDGETISKFLTWQSEHPGETLDDYLAELGAQRARAERAGIIAMKQNPAYREFRLASSAQEHSMGISYRGLDRSKGRSNGG